MAPRTPTRTAARTTAGPRSTGRAQVLKTSISGAEAGLARMRQEEEKAKVRKEARQLANSMPFRYYTPVGETREVIIVDEEFSFFRNEHNLKNPATNRFDLFTPCIDEVANCPVCSAHGSKPSYFAMYLTVIDLTPYTTRDGDQVEWSKKLLVAKLSSQKKLARLYERHGTLRGMVLELSRDSDKDPSIGGTIEFIEFMEEADLETYVTEYTDKDGKVHEVVGFEPFNYEELFPDMTEEELERMAGSGEEAAVGSRRGSERALGQTSSRTAQRRGRAADDEDDQEDAPARPARNARSAQPAAATRPARTAGRRAQVDEDVQEEGETPSRASRTPTRQAAAPEPARRPVRRAAPVEDEDSPLPEDTPPPRAARRAALRGGQ